MNHLTILIVSNFYPPYYIGGYEIGCKEIVDELARRGHETRVLTSTYRVQRPQIDNNSVYRLLIRRNFDRLGGTFFQRYSHLLQMEMNNQREFLNLVKAIKPDIVYFWNLFSISTSLIDIAIQSRVSTAFFAFDEYLPSAIRSDPWRKTWTKRSGRRVIEVLKQALRSVLSYRILLCNGEPHLPHMQCASEYIMKKITDNYNSIGNTEIIPWGVNLRSFGYRTDTSFEKRLLYVGRIDRIKGVHTAIEVVRILIRDYGYTSTDLTLYGGELDSDYSQGLRQMIRSYGLEKQVHFKGFIDRATLPDIYQQYNILIFPSIWNEPFGLSLIEAMACGLAVVGTGTGGSAEILRHEENALCFPKGDAQACAAQINRLFSQPELYEQLRRNGRLTVEKHFRIEHTFDRIEQSLLQIGQSTLTGTRKN